MSWFVLFTGKLEAYAAALGCLKECKADKHIKVGTCAVVTSGDEDFRLWSLAQMWASDQTELALVDLDVENGKEYYLTDGAFKTLDSVDQWRRSKPKGFFDHETLIYSLPHKTSSHKLTPDEATDDDVGYAREMEIGESICHAIMPALN